MPMEHPKSYTAQKANVFEKGKPMSATPSTSEKTQEQMDAEAFLSTCPEYETYLSTLEPFEKEAKRVKHFEYPLTDRAYYEVTSRKVSAMERMVIRLWNHPGLKDNKYLVSFFCSLKAGIEYHINEATPD